MSMLQQMYLYVCRYLFPSVVWWGRMWLGWVQLFLFLNITLPILTHTLFRTGTQTCCAMTTPGSSSPGMTMIQTQTTSMPTLWMGEILGLVDLVGLTFACVGINREMPSYPHRALCPGHLQTPGRWCGSRGWSWSSWPPGPWRGTRPNVGSIGQSWKVT